MSINDKVSQALQWLEDEGWSELIDSRWTLEVYDELQTSGLGLTDAEIRKALDIIIYDKPDYDQVNNEWHSNNTLKTLQKSTENMNRKAVIYARVSSTSDRQDTERQVEDLKRYATAADLDIVKVYTEKASGAKDDREVLAECVDALRAGRADTLLLSELSRLGRSVRRILDGTGDLTKAGVNIHILDLNIDTLLPDGKENPVAKLLLTALGLGAEIERKNIVSRLNSGRKLAIEKGVQLGSPVGSGMTDTELLNKYPEIVKYLKKGFSVRDAAAASQKSTYTVQKVKRILSGR